ncbi:hypothetical protein [Paracidovorax konjaci]|uniref:Uncharacterized protein n=1 Tax=Paracidovorax konjaci TaxID=32040 RepID=A0A1I1W7X1_9BURK|nr:hypothetical protein [Paracidovorax konjaci]SFD90538.1 hypothetical protein SAMN04489710_108143 [Paracidovorax konjaci]
MRANKAGEIHQVVPQASGNKAVEVPQPSQGSSTLKKPKGLASREKTGADAIYTTSNIAPRSQKGVLTKLKGLWKAGKVTFNTSVGPLASGTQTQHPVGRQNQVQAPRFGGGSEVHLPQATKAGLAEAVEQSLRPHQTGHVPHNGVSGRAAAVLGTTGHWAQQALSVMSLGKGPASVPSDALDMLYDQLDFPKNERKDPGGAATESPDAQPAVLDHLRNLVHSEKAKAVIHLASQATFPDGESVDTDGALQRLTAAANQALDKAKGDAERYIADLAAQWLDSVPPVLHERLGASADTLISALNHGATVPDALGAELLINAVRAAFPGDPAEMVQAMEELSRSSPARLAGKVDAAFQPTALERAVSDGDPLLRLACALARQPGGYRMLSRMTVPPATGDQQAALQVAMSAAVELQALRTRSPGIPVRGPQAEWLQAAAAQAFREASPTGEAPPCSPEQVSRQRLAFRGVQNGFMTNESGSSYDRVRRRLDQFSDGALDQTSQRNARAASGRMGRIQNWLSGGLPKAMATNSANMEGLLAPALPAIAEWLPGTRPTMWRKSVMRQMTKTASENGMLPRRDEAVASLHRTAIDIRAHLQARSGPQAAPVEKLMLGILEELGLGAGTRTPAQTALKHLGQRFFQQVEARLGPQGLAGLPPGLHASWQSLRGSHPNAGHLLRLMSEHIDLRALADDTAPHAEVTSQVARGMRTDDIARQAIVAFTEVASAAGIAVHGESPQTRALSNLMQATASALAAVKPVAALRSLRIETFEAVENQLARDWVAILPEGERPSWNEALQQVQKAWPTRFRESWDAMKASGADASRLMRALVDAASAVPWSPPRMDPDSPSHSAAPRKVADAIAQAAPALQSLQRDVHVNRFELAISDTVTLFNDVRGPADAAEVMKSLAHRISLGEKIKSSDARQARLELGKAISVATATPELLTPIAGIGLGRERSMDLNMVGAAMQMQIGTTDSKNASLGLSVGLRGALGHADHEFNLENDEAGIALRFDLRLEAGGETSTAQGVSLRMQRTANHEDTLRRHFTDVLTGLARGSGAQSGDAASQDALALLLDQHPALAVAELSNTRRARTSELAFGANATVRARGSRERDLDDRRASRQAVGIGVQAGVASNTLRLRSVQTESRSGLNVEEYKLSAQHRADIRAGAGASVGLVSGSRYDPKKAAQVRGVSVEARKQLAYSGVDTTLRMTTRHGETWADQTQMIREFENLDDFLQELEHRQHEFVAAIATRDGVPGADPAEKTGRAWLRLQDTLAQAAAASAPGMVFSVVTKLRPQAAEAYDKLQGLIQTATEAGDPGKADGYRRKVRALLNSHDAWVANNLQFKTKAKDESSQSAMLGVLQGKAAAESTRLHEFLPAGAQQVGRTPQQHASAPEDHSERWTPRLTPAGRPLPLEPVPEALTEPGTDPRVAWGVRAETQAGKELVQAQQHAQRLFDRVPDPAKPSSQPTAPHRPRVTLGELMRKDPFPVQPYGPDHVPHPLPRPPGTSFRHWIAASQSASAPAHLDSDLAAQPRALPRDTAGEERPSYPLPLPPFSFDSQPKAPKPQAFGSPSEGYMLPEPPAGETPSARPRPGHSARQR